MTNLAKSMDSSDLSTSHVLYKVILIKGFGEKLF